MKDIDSRVPIVFLCLLAAACGPEETPSVGVARERLSAVYPLTRGPTGSRYLVDQAGAPFFWSGDTAWSLVVQVDLAAAETYLANRREKGFNVVLVNLIEHSFASSPPENTAGDPPFTGRPFATPNEAYFAHADDVIQAAAAEGITVLLDPLYLGFGCGGEGWCSEVQGATLAEMRSWGHYVGTRYTGFDNIVWLIGGDTDPSPVKPKVQEFVTGLLERDTRHLLTAHNQPESFATTPWPGESWLAINNVYSYNAALYQNARTAYLAAPVMPFFMIESNYENEHSATPQSLRAQAYWSLLMGGMGHIFGNCPIWHFGASAGWCGTTNWQGNLDGAGSTSMRHLQALFTSRPWHTLVPDLDNTALTAGQGTWGSTSYATAARASDGATMFVYLPTARTVTINLARISGTQARAWWYDPATSATTLIGAFATQGSQPFTPPASGDWVLVVDDAARGFPAPGPEGPPPSNDVVVDFETLGDGVVLTSQGGIGWATQSGGWKVWDGGASYTKNAFVDSTSQSEVTTTFSLPAGKVLKSVKIAAGSGAAATVKLSSPGNPERVYTNINGSYDIKSTAWTSAAATVTVKITCASQWGASDVAFDDVTYGDVPGSVNAPPTVATAALGAPNPSQGTTSQLTVLGADDGGESALVYTWAATGGPTGGSASFAPNGTNAAKTTLASFTRAGSYPLRATIRDAGGLSVTSDTTVVVNPVLTSVAVTPSSASIATNALQQFAASARDQFSQPLASQPSFAWLVSGGGTISTTGLFTAASAPGGPFMVTATSAGVSGTATIQITTTPPPADVLVDFQSLANGATLTTFGGITWGTTNGGWHIWDGGAAYTKNAYVDSLATTEVTATFTLPAGKVLESLKIAAGSGASAIVKLSSAGNPERIYNDINGSYKTKTLSWTSAAATVTIKITCTSQWGASDLAFDDIIYGNP
jgi:hypothetical protein